MSEAYRARVSTAMDRLEAAERDLELAARRVNEARQVLKTAFAEERDESGVPYLNQSGSCACGACTRGTCPC